MVEKLEKIISQSQNIVFFGGAGVRAASRTSAVWTASTIKNTITRPKRS